MKLLKLFDIKLLKFLLVGVINTIIGAGIMFLLYNIGHCSYWISSAANYIIGGIVSFLLNKFFTFQNHKKSVKQVLLFIVLLIICYLIAYIGAKYLIYAVLSGKDQTLKDNIAMCTGLILYTGLNYIGQRLLVFKNKPDEEQ